MHREPGRVESAEKRKGGGGERGKEKKVGEGRESRSRSR